MTTMMLDIVLVIVLASCWHGYFSAPSGHRSSFSLHLAGLPSTCLVEVIVGSGVLEFMPVVGFGPEAMVRYVAFVYAASHLFLCSCGLFAVVGGIIAVRRTRQHQISSAILWLVWPYLHARLGSSVFHPWLDPDRLPAWSFVVLPVGGATLGVLIALALERALARYLPQAPQP